MPTQTPHDWTILYKWEEEETAEEMTVFGVLTIDDALAEAKFSLDAGGQDYEIYGVVISAKLD